MDLDFVSVHKHTKKELGQYPAILTSPLVNNPYNTYVDKYQAFFSPFQALISICLNDLEAKTNSTSPATMFPPQV